MTKVTEPVRAGLTIAIVPSIARALGRAPPKEEKETKVETKTKN